MTDKRKAMIADFSLLFVALCWGGGFVVVKDALDHITPYYLMGIRFTIGFILMALVFFKKFKEIKLSDLKYGIIIGFILFLGYATQTVGLNYTTASKQAFLTGANVVIVPFIAWILHKRSPGWESFVAAILCLVGIGLLTLTGGVISINFGDMLTIICAVFFAMHIAFVGFYTKKTDPIILSIVQTGVAAIFFMVMALIFEKPPQNLSSNIIFATGYLVIFSTIAAILIQNVAQKYTTSSHAALMLCMESVFGTILAVIILKEALTPLMIFGCLLIFLAILISETKLSFLFRKKST